jgi:osmotically-inducible protein OsmY
MNPFPAGALIGATLLLSACVPAAIIGGSTALSRSVAQERTTMDALTDAEVKLGVTTRLANRSGALYRDVFVDVVEGAVVLTGSVPRAEDRIAATEAAWETPGVAAVDDALTVRGDSGTVAYLRDVGIANQLRYKLELEPGVRRRNYTVTTIDSTVHLTGLARSEKELQRVVEIARTIPGVVRVVSHVLTIDDPRRVSRIAKSG